MARRSLRDIFVRKSVEQMHAEHEHGELKRSLGATNLVLLGIGCIIGTGIFVLTGRAAAQFAGPAIMISFIITGTLCALVALSYAELASAIPVSGRRTRTPTRRSARSPRGSWACCLVLEYGLAASTVAVGWSGYVASFLHDFGIDIPRRFTRSAGNPGHRLRDGRRRRHGRREPAGRDRDRRSHRPARPRRVGIGVRQQHRRGDQGHGRRRVHRDRRLLRGPGSVVAAGSGGGAAARRWTSGLWSEIGTALWDVVTAQNTGQYGVAGIITAAATIFFAYIGFEAVSTAGAESRNPSRDMPIGILGSLIICTILYILTSAVLVGIVPYTDLNDAAPIAKAVNQIGLPWFAVLVKIGAIAGPVVGHARAALRPDAHLLHDGARRPDPARVLAGPPEVQDAVDQHADRRRARVRLRGLHGARRSSRTSRTSARCSRSRSSASPSSICASRVPTCSGRSRRRCFPLTPVLGARDVSLPADVVDGARRATRNFFLVYLVGGIVLYFVYGMWNSKLGKGVVVHGHEVLAETPHPKGLD